MKKIQLLFAALMLTSGLLYSQGFDVLTGVSPMNVTRYGQASVSLTNGKVLVVGGHTQGFQITPTAEIFDPLTGTWTLYNISNPHDGCSFVKLNNGKFMFFGGFSSGLGVGQSSVTTVFDPLTNEFSAGPVMNVSRAFSSAVKLNDNRILIVGNWYNTGDAEIFDPATNTFTSVGIPVAERANPLVFPCNDGGAVIIGGYGNFGSPNYSDVVNFNPTSNEFTTLSTELISGETGWITSWYSNSPALADMRMNNGNYIFMVYKLTGTNEYQYGFAQFNPETKEITRINSSPEMPMYNGTSPNEWAFGLNIMKDPETDYIYIMAVGSASSPFLTRLYSFDPTNGNLEIPSGEASFDYYLYSSSKSWVNGDILCSGGSINGSNFDITSEAKLLRIQNSLKTKNLFGSNSIKVFPNPISGGTFYVDSQNKNINSIEIVDLRGEVVRTIRVNKNNQIQTIEMGDVSKGVYFIRMYGSTEVYTEKVVFN
jgi:hypothetical protein